MQNMNAVETHFIGELEDIRVRTESGHNRELAVMWCTQHDTGPLKGMLGSTPSLYGLWPTMLYVF